MKPFAVADGDGTTVFSDKTALTDKFTNNCQALQAAEYLGASLQIVYCQAFVAKASSVHIHWTVMLGGAKAISAPCISAIWHKKGWKISS
ncbi:hypothetical protein P2G88_16860 [Aliiglaciecola sp. CAU 1673]|uniref:hypothetical protein n=1 Tax=Aliiglaciecola sp. CAU 1673 TaxID=3032595 RepID=UPI0023DC592D|nr:hypothetical protein [Aliiglaciecola sp. CAU 1673]MDF2179926.1 hypothetical protein [Aliiglaciecola sp. CAU 1673]